MLYELGEGSYPNMTVHETSILPGESTALYETAESGIIEEVLLLDDLFIGGYRAR